MQVLCVTELSTPCERQIQKGRVFRVASETRSHAVRTGSPGRGLCLEALLSVAHVVPQPWTRKESDEGRAVSQIRLGEWASLLHEVNIAIRTQWKPVHREASSDWGSDQSSTVCEPEQCLGMRSR